MKMVARKLPTYTHTSLTPSFTGVLVSHTQFAPPRSDLVTQLREQNNGYFVGDPVNVFSQSI